MSAATPLCSIRVVGQHGLERLLLDPPQFEQVQPLERHVAVLDIPPALGALLADVFRKRLPRQNTIKSANRTRQIGRAHV